LAEPRRVRADAERNRHAILAATVELLQDNDPEQVTVERVAATAGVSKATVFHRFGNRTTLMQAVMQQRAATLQAAITSGAAPLGPGTAPLERLTAFLHALTDLAARNAGLMTAHEHAVVTRKNTTSERQANPIYQAWHTHIAGLVQQIRPDLDASLLAHIILGSLHSEPIAQLVRDGQSRRLASCLDDVATAVIAWRRAETGQLPPP
jgi:AcrR family transcriptional regulator